MPLFVHLSIYKFSLQALLHLLSYPHLLLSILASKTQHMLVTSVYFYFIFFNSDNMAKCSLNRYRLVEQCGRKIVNVPRLSQDVWHEQMCSWRFLQGQFISQPWPDDTSSSHRVTSGAWGNEATWPSWLPGPLISDVMLYNNFLLHPFSNLGCFTFYLAWPYAKSTVHESVTWFICIHFVHIIGISKGNNSKAKSKPTSNYSCRSL